MLLIGAGRVEKTVRNSLKNKALYYFTVNVEANPWNYYRIC